MVRAQHLVILVIVFTSVSVSWVESIGASGKTSGPCQGWSRVKMGMHGGGQAAMYSAVCVMILHIQYILLVRPWSDYYVAGLNLVGCARGEKRDVQVCTVQLGQPGMQGARRPPMMLEPSSHAHIHGSA
jgi:hypothetical protein